MHEENFPLHFFSPAGIVKINIEITWNKTFGNARIEEHFCGISRGALVRDCRGEQFRLWDFKMNCCRRILRAFDGESGWIDKNLELRKKMRKFFFNSLQVFRSKFLFSNDIIQQIYVSTSRPPDLCYHQQNRNLSSNREKEWRRQSYQYMHVTQ